MFPTVQALRASCLLLVCYLIICLMPRMVEATPSRSNLRFTINGKKHILFTYPAYPDIPTPYRIRGVLVFIKFIENNGLSCQLTVNNATKPWPNTYNTRDTYSNMIIVGMEDDAIAAGCQSLAEVIESATTFDNMLRNDQHYPHPSGFAYLSRGNVPINTIKKANDESFNVVITSKYSDDIVQAMNASNPTEAIMAQCKR
ncbi:hypothetical protein BDF22DRAFT_669031 [Syncephalis plumigaleata]|nr:hypothetical protein BDF22DRAFT_669031 [Syncephalis plumigaleata]